MRVCFIFRRHFGLVFYAFEYRDHRADKLIPVPDNYTVFMIWSYYFIRSAVLITHDAIGKNKYFMARFGYAFTSEETDQSEVCDSYISEICDFTWMDLILYQPEVVMLPTSLIFNCFFLWYPWRIPKFRMICKKGLKI